ncbi:MULTISPECIES: hypothetical protein [Paenibacillus]|uniref:hypothetical protein n=1 Tax=Paenibacillus TaxID=44249 RepID=UPI001BCB0498|nr:hypothetical protein [Paenibacillus dendritiformis]
MSTSTVRIDDHLHAKMKDLAARKGTSSIAEEYRQALEHWVAQEAQNILLADSQILSRLEDRITKTEERLARMNGRTGMDVAVVLTGILNLLAKQHGVTEKQIYEELRPIAASHFSRSKHDF